VNLYCDYLKSLIIINETSNDYKSWIDESINYVCEQVEVRQTVTSATVIAILKIKLEKENCCSF
jgi:hypothetical protein